MATGSERAKRYRESHPDRPKAATKRSYQKHKEKRQAQGREQARKWRANNREKSRTLSKAWIKANPFRAAANSFATRIERKYGITMREYIGIYSEQEGVCAIHGCGKPTEHLDHCHATNKVRGLLCKQCNLTLGLMDDSIERLQGLIAYLEKHNA